ncbi:MAG: biotin--[acetyl-CoA-carboxylase] ligase [Planctomycetales bacterium]|nr:biotin--[acetyl-CoA-carboxylase] ligase [Planctomycetales bacterium]
MAVPILDVDRIEAARQNAVIGKKLVVFKSTASTNDAAWRYASNPLHHGLCVLAESQTKGRGRRGRTWYSKPGQSILCSILLLDQPIEAELLTLTAAVATAEAINRTAWAQQFLSDSSAAPRNDRGGIARSMNSVGTAHPTKCRIKWPNDILVNDKKLAGILVEKQTIRRRHHFVIGIGINCNQDAAFFESCTLNQPATSLAIETGHPIDRTALVCELLEQFELWLDKARVGIAHPTGTEKIGDCPYLKSSADNLVIQRWLELSGMLGRRVTVECDGKQYSGTCRGVDPAEGLVLQLDRGPVRFFAAGHTTLVSLK